MQTQPVMASQGPGLAILRFLSSCLLCILTALPQFLLFPLHSQPPWRRIFCSLILWVWQFGFLHRNELMPYLSLCMAYVAMSSRFIHAVTNDQTSFFSNASSIPSSSFQLHSNLHTSSLANCPSPISVRISLLQGVLSAVALLPQIWTPSSA